MKYYKITNETEEHGEMQYKTGLNVDCDPFNPNGDCTGGGIYFSREDILAFLCYGVWLREVNIPDGEQIYENPGSPKKWKAHRVVLGERERITLDVIRRLISEGADIHADGDYAMLWAAENGHLDVVKFLISEGADIHAEEDAALWWATENGHLDVVKFLNGHRKKVDK